MARHSFSKLNLIAYLSISILISSCDYVVDRSRASAAITERTYNQARGFWSDVFSYHPAQPPQLPQTRYCYRMASDIVCYDSVQPALTAKLFGYQDGDQISWIQPGGGSLGASGGNPVALQPEVMAHRAEDPIEFKNPLQYNAVGETGMMGQMQSSTIAAPLK